MFSPDRLRGVLDDRGLTYRVTAASFVFTCPLCGKEEKLWMYRATGKFRCYYCAEIRGFRGRAEYAIHEMTGVDLLRLREEIYGVAGAAATRSLDVVFPEDVDDEDDVEAAEPEPEVREWPPMFPRIGEPGAEDGAAYLAGRGIPPEIAALYGIGYSPMRRSVVFPTYVGGKLRGWQYRIIDPEVEVYPDGVIAERLKAVNEGLPRATTMFFQDRLIGSPHAVVGEGPMDGLKCHLVGGNVATGGKALADAQIAAVVRSGVGVVYSVLDPDALPEVDRLSQRLGDAVRFHHIDVPRPYKDIGAMRMADVPEVVFSAPVWRRGRRLPIWFPEPDRRG